MPTSRRDALAGRRFHEGVPDCDVIGVDFGTTYVSAAAWEGIGRAVTVCPSQPCCVAFSGDQRLVGPAAKKQTPTNTRNTISDARALLGRDQATRGPHAAAHSEWPKQYYRRKSTTFSAAYISSLILADVRKASEESIGAGATVDRAVMTVPVSSNLQQREDVVNAAEQAGLYCVRLISEPAAAAVAYALDSGDDGTTVMVFDFGGSSTDATLMRARETTQEFPQRHGLFEVVSHVSVTVGGQDVDKRLAEHFAAKFQRQYGLDLTANSRSMSLLVSECEQVKIRLSTADSSLFAVMSVCEGIDFTSSLSRCELNTLCADLFADAADTLGAALDKAGLCTDDRAGHHHGVSSVNNFVFAGGCSHIPAVQDLVEAFFNKTDPASFNSDAKPKGHKSIDPNQVTALGASIVAALITDEKAGSGGSTTGGWMGPLGWAGGRQQNALMTGPDAERMLVNRW